MGLYDNLGEWQVKCFGVPTIGVSPVRNEPNKMELFMGESGGKLRYFNRGSRVPYKTLHYNYGKDFIVFDYRTFDFDSIEFDTMELFIHIIKNGRYFRSVPYDKFPSRYPIGLVIDNYGSVVNIKTANDFKEIVYDWRYSHKKYDELSEQYRAEVGVSDLLRMGKDGIKSLGLSHDELDSLFKKYSECGDRASNETLKVFRETWYKDCNIKDIEINAGYPIGAILDTYMNYNVSEYDKYCIMQEFNKLADNGVFNGKTVFQMLNDYIIWVNKNEIQINSDELVNIFQKYSEPIPDKVVEDYMVSDEKKMRDRIYS